MNDCCPPNRYEREFNPRFSRELTRRYRRGGLTTSARWMVDFAEKVGLDGATVLEIGGGIGDIQVEALKRGAAHTTNLELSSAYEDDAVALLDEAGLRDRATRMLGIDLAQKPDAVDPADFVMLHRVVCCYPDYDRLLSAAADHAQRAVVFSHPVQGWAGRIAVRVVNAYCALMRREYRAFAHSPSAMLTVLRRHGFEPRFNERSGPWRVVGAVRA
ncbi:SAM-dependent methyltransferase [Microbacterium sp. H1-D42]|uniref:SAM-dependent methyltransferase n=1 Tax=Microbacterium sp. H1-D42 TaxID=2925844 RepID=UPI001F532649|nr:SAM-dependent methyltransferase [Microbacterium sp. H1-D42]UNK69853.1 SAM-dependent methyltransferase [Microbacterium sp. H1-D42]